MTTEANRSQLPLPRFPQVSIHSPLNCTAWSAFWVCKTSANSFGAMGRKTIYTGHHFFYQYLINTWVALTYVLGTVLKKNPLNLHNSMRQALFLLLFYIQATEACKAYKTCPTSSQGWEAMRLRLASLLYQLAVELRSWLPIFPSFYACSYFSKWGFITFII